MTQNNAIDQIKQKETESTEKIQKAKLDMEENLVKFKKEQEATIENAESQLGKEKEQILMNAKSQIEQIKTNGQTKLKEEMSNLDNIPEDKINKAVEGVVNSITE
ncbi:MAG: hypothetical protein ABH835_03785 [Patescibacteria group bacterium]|nr:hypothetical protein [Patescibacteria group bacterium]